MTAPIPVLVVEDERPLAQIHADYLTKAGFAVNQVHNGSEAVEMVRAHDPDLILLDLGLPGLDGVEVCRAVRSFSDCYVIMITAREDEIDKLIGLGVGADDYITKPFSPREVVARAQAAVRRPRLSKLATPAALDQLRFDELTIDLAAREVKLIEQPVHLTRTEYDLLSALAQAPRRVFSRRQLVDSVWGEGWGGDEHIVDVHIAHLRSKLGEDASEPRFIDTVRGIGYRFKAEPSR